MTRAHLAFAGGVVAASLLATAMVFVPSRIAFDVNGKPDPLVNAAGIIAGGGARLGLGYFLLPELYRAGGGKPDIDATRERMWKWIRWPALGAAVSAGLFLAAAVLERTQYGRGQYLMLVSFSMLAASHTLVDILSIVGSSKGYRQ